MDYYNRSFCLEVSGDYACFTRPEMKVERVSYDVITPSAARGLLQAIFWKPAVRWLVKEVEVLNDIKFVSIRRNELKNAMSSDSDGVFVDDTETNRAQRASLILRDVRYRIHAELEFIPVRERPATALTVPDKLLSAEENAVYRADENPGKYYGIFERRVRNGQCFTYPYLGCREFSCNEFRLVEDAEEARRKSPAKNIDRDLGYMLYDLDFSDINDPKPAFFRARLAGGILHIPDWSSEEVRR